MPAETHVNHGPIGRDEIFEIVRDRLADILEIEPGTISEGQSFVDDLDADSLALIELVEALEEELGERTVGFRIEDEDLEDLKTVRDAVDYVFDRVKGELTSPRSERSRPYSTQRPRLHVRATRSCCAARMAHRSWCAEDRGDRRNERLEFLGDAVLGWVVADLVYRSYTDLPEGELTELRKSVVERDGAGRGGGRARPRRSPAARQGRGRRRRAREAVDPVRRAGGGDRRGLPRRRRGGGVRRWSSGCSATGSRARRASASTGSTTRRCCRSWRAPLRRRPRSTSCATTARPRQALLRHGRSSPAQVVGEGEGRSKKRPSRRPPREACARAAGLTANRCLSCPRSRPSGAGSSAQVVGRRIDRVEVGRERTVRRTSRAGVDRRADRRHDHGRRPARQVPALRARHRRRVMIHLRMSGQVLLAAGGRRAPAHTHVVMHLAERRASGRGAVVRRPAHVRRGRRVRPGQRRGRAARAGQAGLDPVADGLDACRRCAALAAPRHRRLKALLLDQHVIAGIGNIYCRRDPAPGQAAPRPHGRRRSTPARSRRLHARIHEVLRAAIEAGGSTLGDAQYVDLDGEGGWYQDAPPGLRPAASAA